MLQINDNSLIKKGFCRHDSSHNVRRRVRTSNYEYSEDREPNIESPSAHVVKPPKTVMESLIYKLFTFAFMAALSPLKTVEYTAEKVAWLFGLRSVWLLVSSCLFTYLYVCRTAFRQLPKLKNFLKPHYEFLAVHCDLSSII